MAVVTLKHNLKKKFRNIQKFFLATIFFKNSFFLWNNLISLYNIYFFHQNRSSRFQEKPLFKFFFPLRNSQKNEFLGLSLGKILLHMDANLWQKFQVNTCGGRFGMLTRLCPLWRASAKAPIAFKCTRWPVRCSG